MAQCYRRTLWYALQGYAIEAPQSDRGMFGHARVLPPDQRSLPAAREIARLLVTKAARRMRRAGYYCAGVWLWLRFYEGSWFRERSLPQVNDDQAILAGLKILWEMMEGQVPRGKKVMRVGVTLCHLSSSGMRQLDFLLNDDPERQRWERVGKALDSLNARFGRTVVSVGPWKPPVGGNVGGKISFTRIPSAEDFQ